MQEVEGQFQQENSILQEELDGLKIDLDGEMRARKEAEKDVAKFEKEIRREREEATRSRAAANERLQDKEEEIGKLRSQVVLKFILNYVTLYNLRTVSESCHIRATRFFVMTTHN